MEQASFLSFFPPEVIINSVRFLLKVPDLNNKSCHQKHWTKLPFFPKDKLNMLWVPSSY